MVVFLLGRKKEGLLSRYIFIFQDCLNFTNCIRYFFPLYRRHREYFYDWCEIGSVYGAPADCIWGGGRVGEGNHDPQEVLALMQEYGISARLTFSNSLLRQEHLLDKSAILFVKCLQKRDKMV